VLSQGINLSLAWSQVVLVEKHFVSNKRLQSFVIQTNPLRCVRTADTGRSRDAVN